MNEEPLINLQDRVIVFTGIDRCGKTTQARLLKKYLSRNNFKPITIHYGKPLYPTAEYQYSYYTQEFYNHLTILEELPRSVLILDRFFGEEYVWSDYRDYSGKNVVSKLLKTEAFRKLKDNTRYFIFEDTWEGYFERDDGDSLFYDQKDFQKAKDKFRGMFDFFEEKGYSPETIGINLDKYSRQKEKSVEEIHNTIKNSV